MLLWFLFIAWVNSAAFDEEANNDVSTFWHPPLRPQQQTSYEEPFPKFHGNSSRRIRKLIRTPPPDIICYFCKFLNHSPPAPPPYSTTTPRNPTTTTFTTSTPTPQITTVHIHTTASTTRTPIILPPTGFPGKVDWFPYTVRLDIGRLDGTRKECSGSLFTPCTVITAANCVFDAGVLLNPWNTYVYHGVMSDRNETIRRRVTKFVPHPNFTQDGKNDIALVILNKPYELGDSIATIRLAPNGKVDHAACFLSAYRGNQMQYVSVATEPDDVCLETYNSFNYDPSTNVCSKGDGKHILCDGGTPLACLAGDGHLHLYGVGGRRARCSNITPSRHVFAPYFSNWIRENANWS